MSVNVYEQLEFYLTISHFNIQTNKKLWFAHFVLKNSLATRQDTLWKNLLTQRVKTVMTGQMWMRNLMMIIKRKKIMGNIWATIPLQ